MVLDQKQVLITDDCHPLLISGIQRWGYLCHYLPDISLELTWKIIPDYQGLIINSKIPIDRKLLDRAENLRFVGRLGSGMEMVDREYAALKGVSVLSSPEGNANAVAEHALGMLLALANNLRTGDLEVRQNIWRREANRGFELKGRTLGIIGFGHTGSQFARKLSGLEMQVLAYDKYKTDYTAEFPGIQETDLDYLMQHADMISLHLPLTDETRHLVNKKFIKRCKPGFILINTSRGGCVKTKDLVQALENGLVKGACLDVFENEKPNTYSLAEQNLYRRLHQLDQVILSPHVAGWTVESKRLLAEILLEKIKNVLYPPKHA